MRKSFTVTPSFLFKLMKHCSKLDNDIDIINTFEKLANAQNTILTSNNVESLEDHEDQPDIPEHLEELRNALEGAVADEDEEE